MSLAQGRKRDPLFIIEMFSERLRVLTTVLLGVMQGVLALEKCWILSKLQCKRFMVDSSVLVVVSSMLFMKMYMYKHFKISNYNDYAYHRTTRRSLMILFFDQIL